MSDVDRRLDKIEENCPAQVVTCKNNFVKISEQLTKGAVKFGQHETRITHVEKCADSIKEDVGQIKSSWNKVMSGIVVACILLAINAILLLANGV